jgi:hypothetical protein
LIRESKTYFYLLSCSPTEKGELQEFVASPFFNRNEKLLALLRELLLLVDGQETDAESLYLKINGGVYSEQQLRYQLSDLNQLIEDFFSLKRWKKETQLKKQFLVRELQQKKLSKFAKQHVQVLLDAEEENQLQDSDSLGIKLLSEETSFRFASENDNRAVDSRLQKLSDSIDVFYFAKKLKYACEMINRSNVLKVDYNIHFISEIKEFLGSSDFLKVPAISIYYHILNSLVDPLNEDHYKKLKQELTGNKKAFSMNELRDMFTFAQNYCIRQLNLGNAVYLEESFSNYDFLLNEKIILVNNNLSQFDFKNITTIALRLKKYEWVKNFISRYISYLPYGERKNAEVYNLSRLYYSVGEMKKALKLMRDVEFTDIYYHLDAKVLLVKIYYDTGSFESIMPLFSSFNNYLRRNKKVSSYQQQAYQNFLKLAMKMFNYKLFDKGNFENIKASLETAETIADINWLKQKVNELE